MILSAFTELEPTLLLQMQGGGRDDAAVWIHQRTGVTLGYVADAPSAAPKEVLEIIRNAFLGAMEQLEASAEGKAATATLLNTVNDILITANEQEKVQGRRPNYSACFTCFFRNGDGLFAAGLGDSSVLVIQKDDVPIRVTVPDPNDVHGHRSAGVAELLPEGYNSSRAGSLSISFPEDKVCCLSPDALAVCLFTDGVEKHFQEFEEYILSKPAAEDIFDFLVEPGRVPKQPENLQDDICVLYTPLPPVLVSEAPVLTPQPATLNAAPTLEGHVDRPVMPATEKAITPIPRMENREGPSQPRPTRPKSELHELKEMYASLVYSVNYIVDTLQLDRSPPPRRQDSFLSELRTWFFRDKPPAPRDSDRALHEIEERLTVRMQKMHAHTKEQLETFQQRFHQMQSSLTALSEAALLSRGERAEPAVAPPPEPSATGKRRIPVRDVVLFIFLSLLVAFLGFGWWTVSRWLDRLDSQFERLDSQFDAILWEIQPGLPFQYTARVNPAPATPAPATPVPATPPPASPTPASSAPEKRPSAQTTLEPPPHETVQETGDQKKADPDSPKIATPIPGIPGERSTPQLRANPAHTGTPVPVIPATARPTGKPRR